GLLPRAFPVASARHVGERELPVVLPGDVVIGPGGRGHGSSPARGAARTSGGQRRGSRVRSSLARVALFPARDRLLEGDALTRGQVIEHVREPDQELALLLEEVG